LAAAVLVERLQIMLLQAALAAVVVRTMAHRPLGLMEHLVKVTLVAAMVISEAIQTSPQVAVVEQEVLVVPLLLILQEVLVVQVQLLTPLGLLLLELV
jgi:hypothetical protein